MKSLNIISVIALVGIVILAIVLFLLLGSFTINVYIAKSY